MGGNKWLLLTMAVLTLLISIHCLSQRDNIWDGVLVQKALSRQNRRALAKAIFHF